MNIHKNKNKNKHKIPCTQNDYRQTGAMIIKTKTLISRYLDILPLHRGIILLFLFFLIFPSTGTADSKSINMVGHHAIAISFDLENSLLIGTSQITLPAGQALSLDCGHLEITGSILKQQDRTPLQPLADSDNIIHIGKQESEQTILISWTMKADQPMATVNLISKQGITLAGFWHPMPDLDMTYSLNAALPEGFSGISEGEQVETVIINNIRQLQTHFPWPTRSINFAAGNYIVRSIQVGKVSLYTYFFPEDDHLSQGYLEQGAQFIRRFEKLIGPFPYSRYAIVANRLPTGYGMSGFTLLGQAVIRLPFIKYTSLGHEILHSWFGNSIGLSEGSGNWSEGLTTYLADQSFAADLGRGVEYRKNQLLGYQAFVHRDNTIPLAAFIGAVDRHQPRTMARKIRAIGYNKSSMVFHMLNNKIGEENFIRGLRKFYSQKKHQRASWQDLEDIFSEVSAQDLSLFFEQWLKRTDIPKLSLQDISVEQRDGQSITTFTLTQTSRDNIPYLLKVPVTIKTISGMKTQEFTINQQQQTFTITTDTMPLELIIDKNYDLFRELTYQETPPTLAGFLGRKQKYLILADDKQQAAIYQPLTLLSSFGVKTTTASQVSNQELSEASFIFAGDSELRRTIFAGNSNKTKNKNKKSGFTLQVRKNPLNQNQYMILIDASSKDEVKAATRKLPHYGKYSYLSFSGGNLVEKKVGQSEDGIVTSLFKLPYGVPARQVKEFSDIIRDISKSRVIYVGETHTDYSHSILQLQIIQALHAKKTKGTNGNREKKNKLAIGMEMFPRSAQPVLDDYISGRIETEKEFLKRSDYFSVWGFDYRLYRSIINFARKNRIPIIALNLERHITRQVFRSGHTDIISLDDRQNIANEFDLDAPGYRERLRVVYDLHAGFVKRQKSGFPGFLQAQALWDETMAESISNYLQKHPEKTMVVITGTGHVYKDSAIPLRVERRIPGIRQSVLITHNVFDTGQEIGRKVDYLIFTKPAELSPPAQIGVLLKREETKNNEKPGLKVIKLSPHGHGLEAGLQAGDIITGVNGEPVHQVADVRISLLDKAAGDTINLEIYREQEDMGQRKIMMITLELTSARSERR